MNLPNFICIGAQKTGTTTLHDILNQHPDIFLPTIKETKFFADEDKFNKGLSYYKNEFFSSIKHEKMIGEIDPIYMYLNEVPKRIHTLLGKDIKLIVILRNPVNRAYSHYQMSKRRDFETESFENAIHLEHDRILKNNFNKNHFSYIDRGCYAQQIKRYLKYFKKENMLFLIFEEDLLKNKEKTFKTILKFLGLDSEYTFDMNIKSNPSSRPKYKIIRDLVYKAGPIKKVIGNVLIPSKKLRWAFKSWVDSINQKPYTPPPLSPDTKIAIMKEFFIDDIIELEELLERDLSVWKTIKS